MKLNGEKFFRAVKGFITFGNKFGDVRKIMFLV